MTGTGADRNLLFGILAVQMDFISRDALIAAMHAWVLDKKRSLGSILTDQRALADDARALLDAMVDKHLEVHGGDPAQSLAALAPSAAVCEALADIGDRDVQASLPLVSGGLAAQLDAATTPTLVGTPTSAGTRFKVLRPHAKGGLGEVFVAHDIELHREVALKEIQARHADDRESRARFVLEAEITGGLEHPGVVPVYGLGFYENGRPFYAMRLIKGDSLKDAIERYHARRGRKPESTEPGSSSTRKEASDPNGEAHSQSAGDRSAGHKRGRRTGRRIRWGNISDTVEFRKLLGRFIDVCDAIEYAHSRGVLHRDLKPDNIMVGKYGETLVVDWGLAKPLGQSPTPQASELPLRPSAASGSTATMAGATVGTPAYMSPEQAAGRLDLLGPASDVYSLGVTLYSLLTGRGAFERGAVDVILKKVQAGDFSPPRAINADTPRALEAICLKAMALDPKERYQSPRALADEIERWLADEPVSAWREPASQRLARWVRRHRAWAQASAAALVLVTVVSVAAAFVVDQARDREQVQRLRADQNARRAAEQRDLALTAKEQAKDEAQKAKRSEADTRAVLTFFREKVLSAARPESQDGGLGVEATIRAAVDAAEPGIGDAFQNRPLVEALIRDTLGQTYSHLGQAELAIRQHERSRQLLSRELGEGHPNTLIAMNNLAYAYQRAGRLAEALALDEQTLELTRARLGPEHRSTLVSMNNLAGAYQSVGRLAEALPLYEQTLDLLKAKLGAKHPDTLTSMNNLAHAYGRAGRQREAIELYQQTLELRKTELGPEHPDTLTSMNNLADAYRSAGRQAEALPLFEQTLKLRKVKLGAKHPDTLTSMNNLATTYDAAGRRVEALELYQRTLELRKARLSPEHPDTLVSMNNLAYAYQAAGRPAEALPLYEQTLELMKARLGPQHPDTLVSMNNLAGAYQLAGRRTEALPLFEQVLEGLKTSLGPKHPHTITSMSNLAAAYESAGRLAEALPLLEQTLELAKAQLGGKHPDTLTAMNNLAMVYKSAGRSAEALELHQQALELRTAELGPEHPDTLLSMNNLAGAYQSAGRLAEALPLYERTLELQEAKLGPEHPDTLLSMNNLAMAYDSAGRQTEALELYQRTLELRKAKIGPEHPDTLVSMNNLASAYRSAGRLAEALPLHERTLELREAKLGREHPHTLSSIGNLAEAYLAAEQPAKALPLLERFVAVHRAQASPDDATFAGLLESVSLVLLQHAQYQAAEAYLRDCLAIRDKNEADGWTKFHTRSLLGGSLLGQRSYADAEALLLAGYEGLNEREAAIPPESRPRLTEALERLVQLYDTWEKKAEADKWRKTLDEHNAALESGKAAEVLKNADPTSAK